MTGRPGPALHIGVFVVTAAGLMLEIGLTRIFSVTMWYHFAFMAISVALFGMTAGALIVHLLPNRFPHEHVGQQLWRWTLAFSLSLAVCFPLQLQIPFTPRLTAGGVLSVLATCAVTAIPFVFSGVVICLFLTRFPKVVNRLYAIDLVGAGVGCVALLVLFSWFDGPSMIMLIAGLAAVAALAFATEVRDRRAMGGIALVAVLLVGFAGWNAQQSRNGDALLRIVWTKEARDSRHLYEQWNAFSRITVDGDPSAPYRPHQSLSMVIDSTAGTPINRWNGDPAETDHLRGVLPNLSHHIRPQSDVFVIGAGGGIDVLSALEFDQRSVTAAEINSAIIDIAYDRYADYGGRIADDPRVHLVNDEGRSYLERADQQFDIIEISLVDTWAASGAGAFALSENSLYTTEAWDLFLDRLTDDGLLTVTRFYTEQDPNGRPIEPLETYRTLALASQVLTDRGVDDPREHIAVYKQELHEVFRGVNLATFMVSPTPLSDGDRADLDRLAATYGFQPLLTDTEATRPLLADLVRPGGPGPYLDRVAGDISPPTDDRPFFFQMADVNTFRDGDILRDDFVTRPVLVLALLALTVLGLAAICIALPLLLGRRRGPDPDLVAGPQVPYYLYFGGIGLGFLLLEIAQLQRLSSFLGHPAYGLAVVLSSVLVFSGLGSMLSGRIARSERRSGIAGVLGGLLAVALVTGWVTPRLLAATAGATTTVRIAVAVAILAPLAVLMGMPFSIGIRAAAQARTVSTPFLWAINGATSVCASVLGVMIALFFGISRSYLLGVAAYALALVACLRFTAVRPLDAAPPPEDRRPISPRDDEDLAVTGSMDPA